MSVIRAAHAFFFFFFNDTATTEIYTLSLHDALPAPAGGGPAARTHRCAGERAAGPGGPAGEGWHLSEPAVGRAKAARGHCPRPGHRPRDPAVRRGHLGPGPRRSEERRVGKECRS